MLYTWGLDLTQLEEKGGRQGEGPRGVDKKVVGLSFLYSNKFCVYNLSFYHVRYPKGKDVVNILQLREAQGCKEGVVEGG